MQPLIIGLMVIGGLAALYAVLQTAVELGVPLLPGVRIMYGQPTRRGWRRIPRVA